MGWPPARRLATTIAVRRLAPIGLALLALLSLGFEWEGRLTRLRRELRSEDPARRREVVQLLSSYPAHEVRDSLLSALEDPDAGVRAEAAQAVGRVRLGEAVPRLLEWLEDPEADVRAAAARALGRVGEERAIPSLVRVLGDTNGDVRRAGVAALATIGTDEVIVPILGRLDDVEAEVRVEAAAHLGHLGDPRAAVPLVGRARDDAPEVRAAVHAALGDLGDPRAVPALVQALRDDAPEPRLAAIAALGRLGAEEAVRPLVALLGSERDPRGPRAIAAALGAIPGAEARAALVAALAASTTRVTAAQTISDRVRRGVRGGGEEDAAAMVAALAAALDEAHEPGHATQIARTLLEVAASTSTAPAAPALLAALREGRGEPPPVLRALGATGAPDVLVPLLERLPSDEVRIRMAVLEALRRYFDQAPPDGRAADPLLAVLGEVTEPERQPIVALLGRVGATRALPTLRTLLAHSDAELRLAAVRAMGAIGDAEGGSALLPLLDDPDARLRYEAARAIGAAASATIAAELLGRLSDRAPTDRHALAIALAEALPRLASAGQLHPALERRALASMLALAGGEDRGLAERALDVLARWRPAGASEGLVRLLASAGPERSPAIVRALGELEDPAAREALRALVTGRHVSLATQAASVIGERGTAEDGALLLARGPSLPWPASAAAAFSLARLARRGQLDLGAHPGLCRLGASHDPFVRANVAVAMAALSAPPCPGGPSPLSWLERRHASVVRVAAARWARAAASAGHLPAGEVGDALTACAAEPLTPDVGAVCAHPELAALDGVADVYAYAPDGARLWSDRLVALRLADGSVWITRSDANGHLRLHGVPRGALLLEDPAATPLEP